MKHLAHVTMEEPERIKRLPHFKGFPIPVTTMVIDGIPNFKAANEYSVVCKEKKLCAICGEPLDYYIAFGVTEGEAVSRKVHENPHHEECLRYAFQICPWIYWSNSKYSDPKKLKAEGYLFLNARPAEETRNERPKYMGIYLTRSYEVVIEQNPTNRKYYRYCRVGKPVRLEWVEGH